jgi:hypothetical protein
LADYVGVFRDLQKAFAIYRSSSDGGVKEGDSPIEKKDELVSALKVTIDEYVEKIMNIDDLKKKYISVAGLVIRLYKAILPDPQANEFTDLSLIDFEALMVQARDRDDLSGKEANQNSCPETFTNPQAGQTGLGLAEKTAYPGRCSKHRENGPR